MGKLRDLMGLTYGRLTVISKDLNGKWVCNCACGKMCCVPTHSLTKGYTKSCGCLRRETARNRMAGNQISMGRKMTPEEIQKSVTSRTKNSARCKAIKDKTTFYFTGKPCKHGHIVPRRTNDGNCVECSKERNHQNPPQKLFMAARTRAKRSGLPFTITVDDIRAVWPSDNRCPIMHTLFQSDRRGEVAKRQGATLDKIDPKFGYVKENIAVISWQANVIKQNCTDPTVFRRLADWLESVSS